MDDHELRRIEQMVKAAEDLYVELPRERIVPEPYLDQIEKEYILDKYGTLRVWKCRDDDGKRFVVIVYEWQFYRYEWEEKEEAWAIARQLQARLRILNRLLG